MRNLFYKLAEIAQEKLAQDAVGLPDEVGQVVPKPAPVHDFRYRPTTPQKLYQEQGRLLNQGLRDGYIPYGRIRENAYRNIPGGIESVRSIALKAGNRGATLQNTYSGRPAGQMPDLRARDGGRVRGYYEPGSGRISLNSKRPVESKHRTLMHEGTHALDDGLPSNPVAAWKPQPWMSPKPAAPAPRPASGKPSKPAPPPEPIGAFYKRLQTSYGGGDPVESRAEIWGPMKRRMAADGVLARTPQEVPGVIRQFNLRYPNFFQSKDWKNNVNPGAWKRAQTPGPGKADPATQYLQTVKRQGVAPIPQIKMAMPRISRVAASWAR